MAGAGARSCDPLRPDRLLPQLARRVPDPAGLPLVTQLGKAGGKRGGPPGGPFSPVAAPISLTEVAWAVAALRRPTAHGPDEAGNSPRFAAEIVIPGRGPERNRGWAARVRHRLPEPRPRGGGEVNREQSQGGDTIRGATLAVWGVAFRRGRKRTGDGHVIRVPPRTKARLALKARGRELRRRGGAPRSRS
jgi:RNA-directed DNA polymerase